MSGEKGQAVGELSMAMCFSFPILLGSVRIVRIEYGESHM